MIAGKSVSVGYENMSDESDNEGGDQDELLYAQGQRRSTKDDDDDALSVCFFCTASSCHGKCSWY